MYWRYQQSLLEYNCWGFWIVSRAECWSWLLRMKLQTFSSVNVFNQSQSDSWSLFIIPGALGFNCKFPYTGKKAVSNIYVTLQIIVLIQALETYHYMNTQVLLLTPVNTEQCETWRKIIQDSVQNRIKMTIASVKSPIVIIYKCLLF